MQFDTNAKKRILVVAAHPDDEVLGCGATIAKLSKEHEVRILVLGEGATSRSQERAEADQQAVSVLQAQAKAAAQILGAASVQFGGLPDNRFDTLPLLDVIKRVEHVIDEYQPTTVFTHHGGDLNIDHQITFRAVLTATRPLPGCPVKDLYSFEIPSSTEWAFQQTGPAFTPNLFVDVAEHLETKIRAMASYEGESRPFPHPRSPDALRAIAQRWGSVAGVQAAEAVALIRSLE